MTTYPKLSEQEFENLPYAFKEMIRHDERKPINPWHSIETLITLDDIKSYKESISDWNENKNNIRIGCQNVVKKQRGSGGSAA